MKKVYTCLIFALFALSFFIGIFIYSFFATAYSISDRKSEATVVNIDISSEQREQKDSSVTVVTKELFYSELKNAAAKTNLNIYKITYPVCKEKEKKKIVVYAHINNEKDFYKNIPIEQGRLLNKNDTGKTYISSEKIYEPNCVGKIKYFDRSVVLEIRPIDSNKNDLMYGKYVLNTSEIEEFNAALKSQQVALVAKEISSAKELNILDENGLENFYIVSTISTLALGIIFACILISCIYILVYRYKDFAVQKMLGHNNLKLIFKFWFEMIVNYLIVTLFSYVGLLLFLYFYNGWAQLKTFLLIISTVELIIFIVFCLLIFILSLLIIFVDVKLMIKNKKPFLGLTLLNNITKIIFCVVVFILGIFLSNIMLQIKNQIRDLNRWEFTKNYAFATFNLDLDKKYTHEEYMQAEKKLISKCDKLYISTNNSNNNILMAPSSALIKKYIRDYYEKEHRPMWAYEMNRVTINNNYLKQNPIYDENGIQVDLTDYENEYVMTILVPEKYKSIEKELIPAYQYHCDFLCEYSPKKLKLNLIYVKDDQKYFTMNPLLAPEKNFEFTNVVAIVINNRCVECGGSLCGAMTQGYYYFHIINPNDPYESMNKTIKELNMENNFITISSLYNFVGEKFYSAMQLIKIYIVLMIVSFIPFLICVFSSMANYFERRKQILSVQYINGYSFFKSHNKLFWGTVLMWLIIFLFVTFVFNNILSAFNFNLEFALPIAVFLSIIDLFIQYFALDLVSIKKIKDVIKGV